MTITKDDVINAYKLLLDRQPESEDVIDYWVKKESNYELRSGLLSSDEFALNGGRKYFSGYEAPFISEIHHEISNENLIKCFDHVKKTWTLLGEVDPMWAVLSISKFKSLNKTEIVEDFYETGKADAELIKKTFIRNGYNLNSVKKVVEYGCGMGRVTTHLASIFDQVIGLDIAESMLSYARDRVSDQGFDNCKFELIQDISSIENMPSFDLFFSQIVLQHSPPPVISKVIECALKAVNPGGFLLFQIPTYIPNYNFNVTKYLSDSSPFMHPSNSYEMHAMSQAHIFKMVKDAGGLVLEIYEDGKMGPHYENSVSNTLFIKK